MQFEMTRYLKAEEYDGVILQSVAWEYLGYQGTEPEPEMLEELAECKELLKQAMKPAFTCELTKIAEWSPDKVTLCWQEPCRELCGTSIAAHLKAATHVLCAAMTLGDEVDNLIDQLQKESMLKALLADALANAAVEGLRFCVEQTLLEKLPGVQKNWLYGIGYGDLSIHYQPAFLEAIRAKERIGLCCNEKDVLVPMKSVTGFLGVSRAGAALHNEENAGNGCGRKSCEQCDNRDCARRRVASEKEKK